MLTASFALWLNYSIFNRENFVRTTVDVIKTAQVRNAISEEIVGGALGGRPAIQNAIGEPIESAISGLLASPRFEPVLGKLAERLNILITAKEPQAVVIDTSGIKNIIKPLAGALDARFGRTIPADELPNSIVLIAKGEIPSIYSWAVVLLWLGPIIGLIGLAVFAGLIWQAVVNRRPDRLKVGGYVLAIGSLVFMILVTTTRAPVLASIESSNGKIVAGSLLDAFSGGLISQTWVLAVSGLLLIGAGYLLPRVWQEPPVEQKLREVA